MNVVYLAYYDDWSGFALFATEVEALRHAVEHSMKVKTITLPCEEVRDAVNK